MVNGGMTISVTSILSFALGAGSFWLLERYLQMKQAKAPPSSNTEKDTLNTVSKDAINAKAADVKGLAKLFYSLYGMEVYPGYLTARFSERKPHESNLRQLGAILRQKADYATQMAEEVRLREKLLQTYRSPNEAKLLKYCFADMVGKDSLLVKLLQQWRSHAQNTSPGPQQANANISIPLQDMFKEIQEACYRFDFFTAEFCEELMEEVNHFLHWQHEQIRAKSPGSEHLNTRLCVLDHLGRIGPHVLDQVKSEFMDVLGPVLYPEICGTSEASQPPLPLSSTQGPLDYRFGFCIGYAAKLDPADVRNVSRTGLIPHTDDSEVTLTIRLGREYTGGGVRLGGLKSASALQSGSPPSRDKQRSVVYQKTGEATLFFGQQMHEVEPVTSGERQMLVIWFRSANHFRAKTCPCCRMFRRHSNNGGRCILSGASDCNGK